LPPESGEGKGKKMGKNLETTAEKFTKKRVVTFSGYKSREEEKKKRLPGKPRKKEQIHLPRRLLK